MPCTTWARHRPREQQLHRSCFLQRRDVLEEISLSRHLPGNTKRLRCGPARAYNNNHQGAIQLFYEDDSNYPRHVEAKSSDGVHFVTVGTLTTNGLDASNPTWGDIAYDAGTGYWYAGFNTPTRDPSTTGGVMERGS